MPKAPDFSIPERLAWQARAACLNVNPEIFFPERGGSSSAARAVCRTCPVCDQCRAYALEHYEEYGIWGNTSNRERRRLRRGEPLAIVQPAQRYRPGSYPSPPLRAALKQRASAYGSISAMSRYVAGRTDLSPDAVKQFVNGVAARPGVSLAWATKVLTALDCPDLISTIWPDVQDVAA